MINGRSKYIYNEIKKEKEGKRKRKLNKDFSIEASLINGRKIYMQRGKIQRKMSYFPFVKEREKKKKENKEYKSIVNTGK